MLALRKFDFSETSFGEIPLQLFRIKHENIQISVCNVPFDNKQKNKAKNNKT